MLKWLLTGETAVKWLTALFALCFTFPSFATTYYLSPTGSDSNNGMSTGTPWQTPNHALNCGDVIQAAASTAYNGSLFSESHWGTVSGCSSSNEFAYLNCVSFDACKISGSGNYTGIWVDKSNWAVEGWEVTVSGSTNTACFQATPNTSTLASIHHILFANNVANGCDAAGFSTYNQGSGASVDYIAIVGNIAYNAAQGSNQCGSGISVYQPIAYDSASGTHIFIAGNFSYANVNVNPCAGAAPTDGEGIILDTFDGSQGGSAQPYSQQAVVENNIVFFNGGKGLYVYNNTAGSAHATIIRKYNTVYGDLLDNNQIYCSLNGDLTTVAALDVADTYNLVQTNSATGCAGNAKYAFSIANGDSSDTFNNNWVSGISGNNTSIYASTGFSLGSGNTIGTNPTFSNPVNPGAPSCGSSANTVACMATVISDYTPTVSAATSYGYQMPRQASAYDPLYPQWLCSATLPSGLVTPGCGASTWYVRTGGGTRYSSNVPTGQCNGFTDADYPGSGVNQACAFGDYRYLYDDLTYGNTNKSGGNWAISGGDTVIIDNTKQWRVGFNGNGSSTDPFCYGGNGPYACSNPVIPAGTSGQHTRILGRNWASCSTGNVSNRSAMTQLFGGFGVGDVLNLSATQYVDVECLEITRHSNCMIHGSPAYPSACNTSIPLSDYDSEGIYETNTTANILLQDVWVHGHTDRGIQGPIGGVVTANRLNVSYNGNAGWDFDDGSGTANGAGASLVMHYSTIEWNGCNQEYPLVDTYPAISCYSQSTGGYGDGIGTPSSDSLNVAIDHSIFRYNTQDGEDFGHIDTGSNTISITDSLSYANNGSQFKWGPAFTSQTFENNLVLNNCFRMSAAITGAPSTFNTNLSDYCRPSGGSAVSFNFQGGQTSTWANNTIVSYSVVTLDFLCATGANCSTATFNFTNNIALGYDDPATYSSGGSAGGPKDVFCGPVCNGQSGLIGTINRANNLYYGIQGTCIAGVQTESAGGTITSEACSSPLFMAQPTGNGGTFTEAQLDGFNFNLTSSSPAKWAGVMVSGLTTDYAGNPYHSPPSMGALEYFSSSYPASLSGRLTLSGAVAVH